MLLKVVKGGLLQRRSVPPFLLAPPAGQVEQGCQAAQRCELRILRAARTDLLMISRRRSVGRRGTGCGLSRWIRLIIGWLRRGLRFGRLLGVGINRAAGVLASAHALILAASGYDKKQSRGGRDLMFQFHVFRFGLVLVDGVGLKTLVPARCLCGRRPGSRQRAPGIERREL